VTGARFICRAHIEFRRLIDNYTLGIDVLEGSLEIEELLLISKGVEFNLIWLNSIDGGHHKDD